MVDDLANVWVRSKPGDRLRPGDDWGHYGWTKNSALWWLQERVLKGFEDTKVTFFVPVSRAPMVCRYPFDSHFGPINETPAIAGFFRQVHEHINYELAYHGTTHGISSTAKSPFVQEWDSFQSLDEAIEVTQRGMEIFREVTGEYPKGGKYCGYVSNSFSDESINQCNFQWWCRANNRGLVSEGKERATDFPLSFFGKDRVVDMPTTMYGHVLWTIPHMEYGARLLLAVLRKYVLRRRELHRQINFLLANRLPILIQEHSARSRTDGLPQTPNIVDDCYGLRVILRRLSREKVWHATCSEIANYYRLREVCRLEKTGNDREFILNDVPEGIDAEISLAISSNSSRVAQLKLVRSDGQRYSGFWDGDQVVISFVPQNGSYRIERED